MSDDLYIGPTALAPGPRDGRSGDHLARIIVIPLLLLLAAVVLVFFVVFRPVLIDGPSMKPTLANAERVLVTQSDSSPKRGDVIVTSVLEGNTKVDLVKRVIGLPGDVVEVRGDVAIVNGAPEPQLGQRVDALYAMSAPPLTVPAGYVYVMGDNRAVSSDSRFIGPVPIAGIDGKVVAVFAPITHLRLID